MFAEGGLLAVRRWWVRDPLQTTSRKIILWHSSANPVMTFYAKDGHNIFCGNILSNRQGYSVIPVNKYPLINITSRLPCHCYGVVCVSLLSYTVCQLLYVTLTALQKHSMSERDVRTPMEMHLLWMILWNALDRCVPRSSIFQLLTSPVRRKFSLHHLFILMAPLHWQYLVIVQWQIKSHSHKPPLKCHLVWCMVKCNNLHRFWNWASCELLISPLWTLIQ